MVGRFSQCCARTFGRLNLSQAQLLLTPANRICLLVDERFVEFLFIFVLSDNKLEELCDVLEFIDVAVKRSGAKPRRVSSCSKASEIRLSSGESWSSSKTRGRLPDSVC